MIDDWQGRGAATALLDALVERAREEGVERFIALVLSENRDALELFEHLAPDAGEPRRSASGNLELVIELPEPGAVSDSLLGRALRAAARGAPGRQSRGACSGTGSRASGGLGLVALGELVADAAHGQHQLGVLGVALDLLAQVGDVDVAGADVAAELRLPQLLHDLLAAEDLARVAGQQAQDLELRARQVDGLAAHGDQVAREVDADGAGARPGCPRARRCGRARGAAAAL